MGDYWSEHEKHKARAESEERRRVLRNTPRPGFKIVECSECKGAGIVGHWENCESCRGCGGIGRREERK